MTGYPLAFPERLSCSTIAFRHEPLPTALAAIASLGFTHVDIGALPGYCPHFDFHSASIAEEQAFVREVLRSGLRLHTFTTDLGPVNEETCDSELAYRAGVRALRIARELGARGVNIGCGRHRDRSLHPLHDDISRMARLFSRLADLAASSGLLLMVEAPHKGNLLRTPDEALELIRVAAHPGLSLILDVNHHHAAGWSPALSVAALGSLGIGLVHLRDACGRENRYPLGAGEIDFTELSDALRANGYTGRCSLEFTDAAPTMQGTHALIRSSLEYLECLKTAAIVS